MAVRLVISSAVREAKAAAWGLVPNTLDGAEEEEDGKDDGKDGEDGKEEGKEDGEDGEDKNELSGEERRELCSIFLRME